MINSPSVPPSPDAIRTFVEVARALKTPDALLDQLEQMAADAREQTAAAHKAVHEANQHLAKVEHELKEAHRANAAAIEKERGDHDRFVTAERAEATADRKAAAELKAEAERELAAAARIRKDLERLRNLAREAVA